MRFAFIAEEAQLGVARLCRALDVSKAGFYAWKRRPPSAHDKRDELLRVQVREAHARGPKGRRKYGSPRVHRALKKQGITLRSLKLQEFREAAKNLGAA